MNARLSSVLSPLVALWALGGAMLCKAGGGDEPVQFWDAARDACVRRTDYGNDVLLSATAVLPDLLGASVCGWEPDDAMTPYDGHVVPVRSAHIFRLQVVLNGLVNPPGTIGSAGTDYLPFLYGPSPVFGFIEMDVDDNRHTGGEITTTATNRYLANVARFGALPRESLACNVARSGVDFAYDGNFYSAPFYERSGADFELVLCGCFPATIVSESGTANGIFEVGETWVLRGRFFQRTGGYANASCVYGGSEPQSYDPIVDLQFSHSVAQNRTTITLVYALDMTGAARLRGECEQEMDCVIDGPTGNHSSIAEAIYDVIEGANGLHGGPLSGPTFILSNGWKDREVEDALRIDHWRLTGLVGTGCVDPSESVYAWTDVGFQERVGDLTADGEVDLRDACEFDAELAAMDGTDLDADGTVNGVVEVPNFAANFSLLDFNYDGMINGTDRAIIAPMPCPADFNCDGAVNSQDFFDFLNAFFALSMMADVNHNGVINSQDFFDFLVEFMQGC